MVIFPTAFYLDKEGYISGKDESGSLEPIIFNNEEEAKEFNYQYGDLLDFEEDTIH